MYLLRETMFDWIVDSTQYTTNVMYQGGATSPVSTTILGTNHRET